jgi:alpha-methylacyl-CoA racemase
LVGVRVVEIVGIGPGPFAAMMLADLGADVIRIDRAGGPPIGLSRPELDIISRGRPNAVVDLKSERGVGVVLDLVERADILIEGMRPGVTERLGIGPEACLERNPRLVYGRMTGWGQDGPLSQTAGHDINYISIAGGLEGMGRADQPPVFIHNLLGDYAGGALYLVAGVLAALTHARASGEGQVVDAAITDGVAHLMAMLVTMQQSGVWDGSRGTGMLGGATPYYDVYETSDGRWMSVGSLEPQFHAALVERLGVELPDRNDFAEWPALRKTLAETFAQRTQDEWVEVFRDSDACVAPVLTLPQAYEHPHNVARGTYVERDGLTQPAPAPRFSVTPASLTTSPSLPGADTRAALSAWGIDDVESLIDDGVAIQADIEKGTA